VTVTNLPTDHRAGSRPNCVSVGRGRDHFRNDAPSGGRRRQPPPANPVHKSGARPVSHLSSNTPSGASAGRYLVTRGAKCAGACPIERLPVPRRKRSVAVTYSLAPPKVFLPGWDYEYSPRTPSVPHRYGGFPTARKRVRAAVLLVVGPGRSERIRPAPVACPENLTTAKLPSSFRRSR